MEISHLLILVLAFILLLALGLPISFGIGISSVVLLLLSLDPTVSFATIAQRMATSLDSFTLLAIPFFILAGELMNRGGVARRLVDLAKVAVSPLPGGLAYVNILACMFFGAISGSAVAAAAAIGGLMVPFMLKEGYDRNFAAAVNMTSSTTGLLIPPSNSLIVYSLASGGVSITALFLAGYLPGILLGIMLMLGAAVFARRSGYRRGEVVTLSEVPARFLRALPCLLLLVVVIGGIIAGIFTATEASAVAVLYSFLLSVVFYREVRVGELPRILLNTAITTAVVLFLVASSMAMSWVMSYENIPQTITAALVGVTHSKFGMLLLINLILLFVGTFMDLTPAVLIFTPIFLPIVKELGVDPVHFGIIMVLNLCIGLCTPPVGSALFVGCAVAQTTIRQVMKPLLLLYVAMLVVLLIVTAFPEISLFIPRLFGFVH